MNQITIFYGERSNEEFLLHSGFVPLINRHNYLPLSLGISSKDKLASLRSRLCTKAGVPVSGRFRLTHRSRGLDANLLCFLRIFLLNSGQCMPSCNQTDSDRAIKRNGSRPTGGLVGKD